jgi:hypothetical protein
VIRRITIEVLVSGQPYVVRKRRAKAVRLGGKPVISRHLAARFFDSIIATIPAEMGLRFPSTELRRAFLPVDRAAWSGPGHLFRAR